MAELYEKGLCLQAYEVSRDYAPLHCWTSAKARTLAGRLAANLGGERLARVLHWLAWRSNKKDPELIAYHAHGLLQCRGPIACYEFLERNAPSLTGAPSDGRAYLLSVHAMALAQLRDFLSSEAMLARAAAEQAAGPWILTVEAFILEQRDRYPESLAAARRAHEARPWYRPAVQAIGHALQLLDRDDEALAFLNEASRHLESVHVIRQLALLQQEHGLFEEALLSLARVEQLAPLADRRAKDWVARQRVHLHCLRRDSTAALAGALQLDDPYHRDLAERLRNGASQKRVLLELPFVRQHHMTCAPATLSAIGGYWGKSCGHLEVAEAICYDGTPAHSERRWAESHGWKVREFTVTWNAALMLLDRGIPFTLTTSETTSAHLQAVVGYDELRQTVLIRDPFVYYAIEGLIEPLLERYRSTGPRGMALVPAERGEMLDGLELPDADAFDLYHRLNLALAEHRREEAQSILSDLDEKSPGHRLTLNARRSIAAYDGNTPALLESLEKLLERHPKDGNLNLCRLDCLRELARRDSRLEMLSTICQQPGTDPVFFRQYAQELRSDARDHKAAMSWIRWALRYRPTDPMIVATLADVLWDQRRFPEAIRYYRLSSCLGDKNEQFASQYFLASRHLHQTDTAVAFLRDRCERLSAQSSGPGITLVQSLQNLGRTVEAFEQLEELLAHRTDDGWLRLFAADFNARFSRFDTAGQLLDEARERTPQAAWQRTAATLADLRALKTSALHHWREVIKLQPLAHDAIQSVTLLLAETEGRQSAMAFLDDYCNRFPFSSPLLSLRIHWLKQAGAPEVLQRLRELLAMNPTTGWAWRELALALSESGNAAGAVQAADECIRLEPQISQSHSVRGEILVCQGKLAQGRAEYLEALRLEIDNSFAVNAYVKSAPTLAEQQQALAIIAEELRRQVIFAGALETFCEAARGVLPAEEVLSLLKEANAARPDLWQSWSVLINQHADLGHEQQALAIAIESTRRFPLLPRLWIDLARVHHARLDPHKEMSALEKALEISPGYGFASRTLAALCRQRNESARARTVLEQAIAANPLDALNHSCLAELLWDLKEHDAAISRLQHALRLQPANEWAWNALRAWGVQSSRRELAIEAARDLTQCRAGESHSWLRLAQALWPNPEDVQSVPSEITNEVFGALDHALQLNPRYEEALDLRARLLAQLSRFEEALAACTAPGLVLQPPRLRLRIAWIEHQRGGFPAAIEHLKALLAERPDYYPAWQALADWQSQAGNIPDAIAAARKMSELAPLQPVPLGYLGDLSLRNKDRAEAKLAFERAFTLDPDYEYAGFQLFGLQLEARELVPAEETFKILCRRGPGFKITACAAELAVARGQRTEALSLFSQLCADVHVDKWTLARVGAAIERIGGAHQVALALDEWLERAPSVAVAEYWVDQQASRPNWAIHRRLASLPAQARHRAVIRYLDHLGNAFANTPHKFYSFNRIRLLHHLRRLLKEHRSWLQTDILGWGKLGYVLVTAAKWRAAQHWLGNWRTQPKAESWMLYNLILALQHLRRHGEAADAVRHGVTLRHDDLDSYVLFRLWAAFEEAIEAHVESSSKFLAQIPANAIGRSLQPVKEMTEMLISIQDWVGLDSKSRAAAIRARLNEAFSGQVPHGTPRYVRSCYRRLIRALGANATPGLRLWALWFYRGSNWNYIIAGIILLPLALINPFLLLPVLVMGLLRARQK